MNQYTKALTHRAIEAALMTRTKYGYAIDEPACVFNIALAMGLRVKFERLETKGFEGIYSPSISQITLEPQRPSLRQRFTCAHEIGHYVFRHGQVANCANIDGAVIHTNTRQEEFLANVFAAFLLMPKAAVLTAFRARDVTISQATALDFYIIACSLGVGFVTLINHCAAYLPTHLSPSHAVHLRKHNLSRVRAEILDGIIPSASLKNLAVYAVSSDWKRPIDLVVSNDRGDIVKLDFDLLEIPTLLMHLGPRCYRAIKEGSSHIQGSNGWTGSVRCYNPSIGGWWKVRIAGDD